MRLQILLLLLLPFFAFSDSTPITTTCIGGNTCYEGSLYGSFYEFTSYQGIRYALPPIGDLRFKAPLPYIPEEGTIYVGDMSSIMCPQDDPTKPEKKSGYSGQEDCLMLNVYVPPSCTDGQGNCSVMAWIHGGGFTRGSNGFNQYNPEHLVSKGVIVVTINYRLGALGFLSLGTESVPGNAGFKDQIMALTWIQENIGYFGGNPESVTIFGESAGAFSIAALYVSPLANGLFHRMICQSGTILSPSARTLGEEALTYSDQFAENLECEKGDLSCLQEQSIENILSEQIHHGRAWLPVMDGEYTAEPMFHDSPEVYLATGQFNTEVDVIIGTNSGEGVFFILDALLDPTNWDVFRDTFDSDGVKKLFQLTGEPTPEDIEKAHQIIDFYVGSIDNINSDITEEHLQGFVDYITDGSFLYGSHTTLDYIGAGYLLDKWVTYYQYIFSYENEYSIACIFGHCGLGVAHAEELQYIWSSEKANKLSDDEEEIRFLLTTAWTNFAKTGNPGFSWLPQNPVGNKPWYWNINSSNPVMEYPREIHERMRLWDNVLGQ